MRDAGAPRRLAVCHVITRLELGGAQQNTLYTVAHLDPSRFDASLVAGPDGLLDDEARALAGAGRIAFETAPGLVRELRPWRDAAAFGDLVRRFRRLRPDVVHTHSSKAGILGRAAAALAGVPVVVHTVHGWGFHPEQGRATRALYVALERAAAGLTTQLVAVSRANAAEGARRGIAPEERFRIVRSGIALERFRDASGDPRLRHELGLDAATPLCGMVACLKPQKAPLDFVAVAARVAREVPAAHFVLAGDGELRDAVTSAVAEAGLGGRFHLLGWRRDPEAVVGALDVLVLTSVHEGLPRVVPEAMAAGRPVVATAVDGTPEALRDGETGFLHRVHDVDGLAASVARLLRDPALARRLGAAGAARADEWDIDAMVRAQERLYVELAVGVGLCPASVGVGLCPASVGVGLCPTRAGQSPAPTPEATAPSVGVGLCPTRAGQSPAPTSERREGSPEGPGGSAEGPGGSAEGPGGSARRGR